MKVRTTRKAFMLALRSMRISLIFCWVIKMIVLSKRPSRSSRELAAEYHSFSKIIGYSSSSSFEDKSTSTRCLGMQGDYVRSWERKRLNPRSSSIPLWTWTAACSSRTMRWPAMKMLTRTPMAITQTRQPIRWSRALHAFKERVTKMGMKVLLALQAMILMIARHSNHQRRHNWRKAITITQLRGD